MKIGYYKRIQKLCPGIADCFTERKLKKEARELYENKYEQIKGTTLYSYLRYLHDSQILEFIKNKNEISIMMNDFIFTNFIYALCEYKKINIDFKKQIFPVTFIFKNLKNYSFNKVKESGIIKSIDTIKFKNCKEYLYDEIISLDENGIEIGFVFYTNKREKILFLISSCKIDIIENQLENFKKIFGEDYNGVLSVYLKRRQREEYLSYTEELQMIQEYYENNK